MCRFLAWIGAPRHLGDFVLDGGQSLVVQSRQALIGKTPLNADGFGLAWYADRATPCIYKDPHPAWSDANLRQIAHHTRASVFLAHVRASTSTATSRNNCHPFGMGRWSFMHNGQVGGHLALRQRLDAMIPPDCYVHRHGATDSEVIFLLAAGLGLDADPIGAMERAVERVEALSREGGVRPHMRFAACWSDGTTLYAARHASDRFAPSLFFQRHPHGFVVSSEPLDGHPSDWTEVAPGTAIAIRPDTIARRSFRPAPEAVI